MLPNTNPALPSHEAPIFGDTDAARGDHMRANNVEIWGNFTNLDKRTISIERETVNSVTYSFTALNAGTKYWRGICADSNNYLYATVYGGIIYKSTDGGGTFTALNSGTKNWNGICTDSDNYLYATVNGGDIYKSIDVGGTWTALNAGTLSWTGICSDSNNYLYALVEVGDIYKSIDVGGTWTALNAGTKNWYGICADSNNYLYALESDIYKSTDGGGTFTALNAGTLNWNGICADSNNYLYATVYGGDILKIDRQLIAPSRIKAVSITTTDITETDGGYSTYRLYGVLAGNRTYILPVSFGCGTIICDCSGSYYIIVKTSAGTGVYIAPGQIAEVYNDGTNIKMGKPLKGYVTKVTGQAATGMNNGVTTTLDMGATRNLLSEFSDGAETFTPKHSGWYRISGVFSLGNTVSGAYGNQIQFGFGGEICFSFAAGSGYYRSISGSLVVNLTAGTAYPITGYIDFSSGSVAMDISKTAFTIEYIG
jgi:hypothetical protein